MVPFFQKKCQRSVTSCTLFLIVMISISKYLDHETKTIMYADDLAMFFASSDLQHIKKTIQASLKNLESWSEASGLQFSPQKRTRCNANQVRMFPVVYFGVLLKKLKKKKGKSYLIHKKI